MPEMQFRVRWPDGAVESCYSPSLVIKDYFQPGASYPLEDFLARSRTALNIASARVEARYGHPCSLALGQLARIEGAAARFITFPDPHVAVEGFDE
ncbi:MSMEG_0570 family nitrogen starvation response protein [Bosea sp. 117]|uniref:MSMEG_0570 family nitrogen starvation response protein n=1 Tax=Bosea sp. 117 TaxID=1125973 RepID=UPI0004943BA3|nr:MSMEG_0570 family nitrogen starvation response protein [Bosea sp. 117]